MPDPALDIVVQPDDAHPVSRSFGQPLLTRYMSAATAEELDRRVLRDFGAARLHPSCRCGWTYRSTEA